MKHTPKEEPTSADTSESIVKADINETPKKTPIPASHNRSFFHRDSVQLWLQILSAGGGAAWEKGRRPLLFVLAGCGLLLVLIPLFTYIIFAFDLKSKDTIINKKNAGVILTDRNDKVFFTLYQARTKKTIPLSAIPDAMKHAVLASEDRDFYHHSGFSLKGIGRSLLTDVQQERLAAGGSTISQQLVKNTLLSQNKNFLRKYQELVLAMEIERRFSKDDILEMYLNTIYLGEGAFGIEDAAHTYFGKSASQLSLGESALLAAILPAPSALSPLTGDKTRALERQKVVLSEMEKQGYITHTQEQGAASEDIAFNPQHDDLNVVAPHFALMVKDELIKRYGEQEVAQSGFTVKTTLDLSKQQYAETVVKNQVIRLTANDVTNGAAVAIDPKTREIIALVGSHDWNNETNGKLNMATTARQPGSSFKPFVYAKAFEERLLTPGSILDDKAITFSGGYKPQNYDHKFRGKVTVRRSLANSLNIPAVLTLQKVGVGSAVDFAKTLGITTLTSPSKYGLSLVLGAAEVPLIQMTNAYAVFASGGQFSDTTTILQIKDKNNNSIYTYTPSLKRVLDPTVPFLISSILSDNAARAEEFGGALTISRPAAVKTGTTNDYRDSLTIGYTPSLVVGVWVGNNDNASMDNIAGSLGAAPIWRQMMENFLAGTPVEKFDKPFGIQNEFICRDNGLKSENTATTSAYLEYFISGTAPTQSCNNALPSATPTPQLSETPSPTDKPQDTPTPQLSPTEITTPTQVATPSPSPTGVSVNVGL